jgi:hypothetical protein
MWARRALVRIVHSDFTPKSFGASLRTRTRTPSLTHSLTDSAGGEQASDVAVEEYTVSPALCHPPSDSLPHSHTPSLGVGALLAVLDELSTYALMHADTNARPGVSVHLSAGTHSLTHSLTH